jgi:hypothetical protein
MMSEEIKNEDKINKIGNLLNTEIDKSVYTNSIQNKQDDLQNEICDFIKERMGKVRKISNFSDDIEKDLHNRMDDMKNSELIRLYEITKQAESNEANNLLNLFKPEKDAIQPVIINNNNNDTGKFSQLGADELQTMDKFNRFLTEFKEINKKGLDESK